uniref:hypothetical protein n=1 Tax=uncultured Caulobacter sp. TaxID=158749 RepID=UPI0025EE19CF|nr:hypothetical protein [uncultured Caulobacter sp.]
MASYFRMQVAGWSVSRDGALYPITADGINDGEREALFILTPDGRVSQAENRNWALVVDWLADPYR